MIKDVKEFTENVVVLIEHSEYIKTLRPLLPAEAFRPDPNKLLILLINIGILLLGWGIARNLNHWPIYWIWLYLPMGLIMANSVTTLLIFTHELMHGSILKGQKKLDYLIRLLGFSLGWMPPTQWHNLHNLVHHNHTNSLADPDRSYLMEQPNTWGKSIRHLIVPSHEVNRLSFLLGMITAFGFHNFCNLSSIIFLNEKTVDFVPAAFTVSRKHRLKIVLELFLIFAIHFTIVYYLQFEPIKLIFAYFLPIALGHAGVMFYIYTNHLACRMTEVNDPLINSVSLKMPKIFDTLHLNFSYHTEHHLFPSLNSDYYPLVRELLEIHYPGRMNLLSPGDAWRLLLTTPRHYQDETTLTDYAGKVSVPCPLQ